MNNETIGKLIVSFISIISIIGMGSTIYSLLCEKDTIRVVRKKPSSHYPITQKEDTNSVVLNWDQSHLILRIQSEWSQSATLTIPLVFLLYIVATFCATSSINWEAWIASLFLFSKGITYETINLCGAMYSVFAVICSKLCLSPTISQSDLFARTINRSAEMRSRSQLYGQKQNLWSCLGNHRTIRRSRIWIQSKL